jgi:hypothetical protein
MWFLPTQGFGVVDLALTEHVRTNQNEDEYPGRHLPALWAGMAAFEGLDSS